MRKGQGRNRSKKTSQDNKRKSTSRTGRSKANQKVKYIDYKNSLKKGDPLPNLQSDETRLNKYISNAGICSRREADVLIQTGVVSVNDEIITEMGYKVKPGDVVKYDGETISAVTKRYVLLNKPKGVVTDIDDALGRKNVLGLVKKACKEMVYPMDRLSRDTTGLLLLTNDSDLAKKLSHPKHKPVKLYHVQLNKPIGAELKQLREGVRLEDGTFKPISVEIVEDSEGYEIGVEHRSGQKQVIDRALEVLGLVVKKKDRVMYAGLTKKDLPRGRYRHLSEKEVSFIKMNS